MRDARPPNDLRDQLLAAGREEAPPDASLRRALALAESPRADAPRSPDRRVLWALAAAAVFAGVIVLAAVRNTDETGAVVAEPLPPTPSAAAAPSPPTATVAAAAPKPSPPTPGASATPSAIPSSSAMALGPTSPSPKAAAEPGTKPPPTTGGCPPNDLMCNMRQSQKKKQSQKQKRKKKRKKKK